MMGYESDFMDHVFLEAVDTRTHEAYGASVLLADDSDIREHLIPPPKDMAEPETDHTNTTIGEVLRANLAKMIDLPAVETSTSSYASLGPYRSNTLTVKLVRRSPAPEHEQQRPFTHARHPRHCSGFRGREGGAVTGVRRPRALMWSASSSFRQRKPTPSTNTRTEPWWSPSPRRLGPW